MSQKVRFCASRDGTALAYTVAGKGPAVLQSALSLNPVEYSESNLLWRAWTAELSRHRTYVQYDARGFGMSGHDPRESRSRRRSRTSARSPTRRGWSVSPSSAIPPAVPLRSPMRRATRAA